MHVPTRDNRPTSLGWRAPAAVAFMAVLAALSGPAGRAGAQEPGVGSVRGSVIEAETDTPVRSATVILVPLAPSHAESVSAREKSKAVSTDARGEYAFENVAPGRYRIDVSGLGYRPSRVWIDLPRPWQVRRSVALEVDPVQLDPVEIELRGSHATVSPDLMPLGPRKLAAPSGMTAAASPEIFGLDMRVLDPAHLPSSGSLGEPDVFRALERLPGVSTRGDFSANLWTRGAPWGMSAILLDGLPLYDPLHLGGIVSGLSADGLQSVALMPGVRPPSAAEGAAGTIALSTRRAERRSASLGASSLAVRSRVEDRILDDRVGVMFTARRSWWDLISPPAIFAASESRAIDYSFIDTSGRFDARLGRLGRLEGGGLWEQDRLHGDIAGVVSTSDGRWGNRLGWLRLSRSSGRLEWGTRLGRVAYRVATRPLPWHAFVGPNGVRSIDQIETAIDHTSFGTDLRSRSASGRLTWGAGIDVVHERLSQAGLDARDRGLPGVRNPARLNRVRAWTEATLKLWDFDLAGGVGANRTSGGDPSPPPLPSLRVRWSPTSWLTLEGARGKSIQFIYPLAPAGGSLGPDLGVGYTWIIAGNGTPPLVSDISTGTVALSLPDGVFVQVTRWWRRVDGVWLDGVSRLDDGVIEPAAGTGNDHGSERGRGAESRIGWRDRRFDVEAAYSVGRSRFAGGAGPSWPSPAERRNSLDLHAQAYLADAFNVALDYTSETGWPLVMGPTKACGDRRDVGCVDATVADSLPTRYSFTEAPRYESLDLTLRWTHRWGHFGFDLVGSVSNVLGRANAEAFRAGTCDGAELVSSVCEQSLGVPNFSPGLTRPTPSLAVKVRF